jgi:hypothetical protein
MLPAANRAENKAESIAAQLEELERLPAGSPELEELLPDWIAKAHLRWLETGEGDPWGGYFR